MHKLTKMVHFMENLSKYQPEMCFLFNKANYFIKTNISKIGQT